MKNKLKKAAKAKASNLDKVGDDFPPQGTKLDEEQGMYNKTKAKG